MNNPLKKLLAIYDYDPNLIKQATFGTIYTAIMLENGNIGVCANIQETFPIDFKPKEIDLTNNRHRIFYQAYCNALLNYNNQHYIDIDISDFIASLGINEVVMVGYFEPIIKLFKEKNIQLNIFDLLRNEDFIKDQSELNTYLQQAKCVVLTATSIFNNSFVDIIKQTNPNGQIYLLGPSSMLNKHIFEYDIIKGAFGSLFKNNDMEIINIIENNMGTRKFIKHAKKVCYLAKNQS